MSFYFTLSFEALRVVFANASKTTFAFHNLLFFGFRFLFMKPSLLGGRINVDDLKFPYSPRSFGHHLVANFLP